MSCPALSLLAGIAGALLLSACGRAPPTQAVIAADDPAVTAALTDPLMTDPDLVSQNQGNAALVVSGPLSAALPPIDASPEAIATAKVDAARLAGGTPAAAPAPEPDDTAALRIALTAVEMATAARVTSAACMSAAGYTAGWAAMLPDALQVYPRGAVEEAAGADDGGCRLRVVHFRTPVAGDDIVAWYFARLRAAGYSVRHGAYGGDHALRGRKGGAAYLVYVRPGAAGLTAVDVVTAG